MSAGRLMVVSAMTFDIVTGWNPDVDGDGNPDEAKQRKCGKHFEAF